MSEQPSEKSDIGLHIRSGLATVAALFILGLGIYLAYENYRREMDEVFIEKKLLELEKKLNSMAMQINELSSRIDNSEMISQTDIEDRLSEFGGLLEADLEVIRGQLGGRSEEWLLREVEYLIRIANQRILIEKDTSSAIYLLISADRLLSDTEGLLNHDLRQAIARDVAALKALDKPDVQGIYLELSAMIGQVPDLKYKLPEFGVDFSTFKETADSPSEPESAIQPLLQGLEKLYKLVDFRRSHKEVRPILPPDQVYYLRQNLVLKLRLAQMALLEGEDKLYVTSLKEAQVWLNHFDSDMTRQTMAGSLKNLGALQIDGELPDISYSLDAIRKMLLNFSKDLPSE